MEILLVAAITFLLCWLVDKGFTKLFRSKPQHKSGQALRLNKHYGGVGVVLSVLGVAAVFAGLNNGMLLLVSGVVIILLGVGLIVYYITYGIYYDEDGFVSSGFGRKSHSYAYSDISGQQLYVSGKQVIVELCMKDGSSVQLQSGIKGAYAFLDYAFAAWLRQTGKVQEDCKFHDPDQCCWFPPMEG